MKNCPVCFREYSDQVQYCTRDGSRLQSVVAYKHCPECNAQYPTGFHKCLTHNLDLIPRRQPSNTDSNFCSPCNKYYPPTLENCPVHGIALKAIAPPTPIGCDKVEDEIEENLVSAEASQEVDEREEKERFEVSLPLNMPSPFIVSAALLDAEETDTNKSEELAEIVAPQTVENEIPAAANTRELEPPRAFAMNTLTQYSPAQYASEDRRLIAILTLVAIVLAGGFLVYALPKAISHMRARTNTPVTPVVTPAQEPAIELAKEPTTPTEAKEQEETEIVQRIELKPTVPASVQTERGGVTEAAGVIPTMPATASAKSPAKATPPQSDHKSGAKTDTKPKNEPTQPSTANRNSSTSMPTIPAMEAKGNTDKTGNSGNNEIAINNKPTSKPVPASGSDINESKTVDKTSNETSRVVRPTDDEIAARPKVRQSRLSKIVATVSNKSRRQVSDGFVYYFDLVLREVTGLGLEWRTATVRKISYSGQEDVVSNVIADQIPPNGSARYRMRVKLAGRCIEDWFGQLIFISSGVDENGNKVELEYSLLLDNSFPTN
ncbi:MAG: hypothetical protein AB1489_04235 [Acidobacteriota bacterium]